jgi:hypothetical protein
MSSGTGSNDFAGTLAGRIGSTNFMVEAVKYHTITVTNGGALNVYIAVDFSLDGYLWLPVSATNTIASGTIWGTNFLLKTSWLRCRWYGSNQPTTILYLGGN